MPQTWKRPARLSGREKLFALMVEEARFRDRRSFGSDGNHAAELGVSRRTIIRWKCQLEAEGRIERDGYHVWGPRIRTVRYKFPGAVPPNEALQAAATSNRSGRPPNVTQRLRRYNPPPSGLRSYVYGRTNALGWHANRGEMEASRELATQRLAAEEYPRDAQGVVGIVVDTFTAKGIPIPSRHKGMLARQAKELLSDGFDYETVVVASVVALRRGQPHNAHFIASDLVFARAGERMTRREYEKALQDEMELR